MGIFSNIQKVSLGPESEAVDTESEGSGAIGTEASETQKVTPRIWDLMEFTLLNFELAGDQLPPFISSIFFLELEYP